MNNVEFPSMRSYVLDALRALADRNYQEQDWGVYRENENRYDDLTLNINLLYDDCQVLPNPEMQVGSVLFPEDVKPLQRLGLLLDPIIDELGDRPDSDYLADLRWDKVVEAASAALSELEQRGG